MRIGIAAIGRMKSGPDAELVARYSDRLARTGAQIGIDYRGMTEFAESRRPSADERKAEEAERLIGSLPAGATYICLDENGRGLTSHEFANLLATRRDEGERALSFVIGGPDGHGRAVLDGAHMSLRFGRLTWPHQLVRIMLAEQLYRAVTILSGHPYHRD